ncbi:Protoporphyrinogen oxidase [Chlamydiales bacterium SCGC AG-110-M15]|nr:Protoporphyrinogen oxidase [Chlamydiales bacterium SCGC AG-110-M15]
MKHFVIMGGGISGLSLAWFLKRRFQDSVNITIIEAAPRVGGWISTHLDSDYLFEKGPRGFRPKAEGLSTLRLIEQLSLQDQVIEASADAGKRYLWKDDILQKLPEGLFSLFTSPLTRHIPYRLIREVFTPPQIHHEDESIYNFVSRRFGHDVAEELFDPLTSGIFAGNIKKLSINSCFPYLREMESQYRSVTWGMMRHRSNKEALSPFAEEYSRAPLLSFKAGMETLPLALQKQVEADILLNKPVKSIDFHDDKAYIHLNGETIKADHIFSTVSATALANVLPEYCAKAIQLLNTMVSTSICTVNVGFSHCCLPQKGFGYLVPSNQREEILGMTWDSDMFPQQNQRLDETRLTVMIGGDHDIDFQQRDEGEFTAIALRALKKHLNIHETPDEHCTQVNRYAIPQYYVGHKNKVNHIRNLLSHDTPFLSVLGKDFSNCGINHCIANAEELVDHFIFLSKKSPPSTYKDSAKTSPQSI